MVHRNRARSPEEYGNKRQREVKHRKAGEAPVVIGHPVSPEPTTTNLSGYTFIWDGSKESPFLVPDLLNGKGIDAIRDGELREELRSRGDASLNSAVKEYVNHIARGESVPSELEQVLSRKDPSLKIASGATFEGIKRWHKFSPNGSHGKERG